MLLGVLAAREELRGITLKSAGPCGEVAGLRGGAGGVPEVSLNTGLTTKMAGNGSWMKTVAATNSTEICD